MTSPTPPVFRDPFTGRLSGVERVPFSDPIYNQESNHNLVADLLRRIDELERRGA